MSTETDTQYTEFIDEYHNNLKGRITNKNKLKKVYDLFFEHTMKSFVDKEYVEEWTPPVKEDGFWLYASKDEAIEGWREDAKISPNEGLKIYWSVDNIHSYC